MLVSVFGGFIVKTHSEPAAKLTLLAALQWSTPNKVDLPATAACSAGQGLYQCLIENSWSDDEWQGSGESQSVVHDHNKMNRLKKKRTKQKNQAIFLDLGLQGLGI